MNFGIVFKAHIMTKLSKSPERLLRQKQNYIDRCLKKGIDPADYIKFLDNWEQTTMEKEEDLNWAKNNLEYDLRSCEWILNKVRSSRDYGESLYAALCNNEFIKREMWEILKDEPWSCSWRYAGGILADMIEEGDYMDWYCNGNEGHITEEIKDDLYNLGWIIVNNE